MTPEGRSLALEDGDEDVDHVSAAIVLEGRAGVVCVRPLRKALRCRPDLLVHGWRLAV
jgi:hypothetical protein